MSEERLLHLGFYYTDYWTKEDQLHFSDFRQVLCDILMNAATPLTVGVFGPWGSGKWEGCTFNHRAVIPQLGLELISSL